MELRQHALQAFCQPDPNLKAAATLALGSHGATHIDCAAQLAYGGPPGKPAKPELVHPQEGPRRSPFTAEGHCALMHSIAHIEFSAIYTLHAI